jgi:hypothetical protein
VKLGIIARCDNRGIAYQTLEAVNGLKPDKVLVVMMNDKRWPEEPSRFGHIRNAIYVDSNMLGRRLDETKARKFLDGLDVVFAVETLYDWEFADWAREMGVRTVVQGNPEFYSHHTRHGWGQPQPDQWAWPTTWMTDHDDLPEGPLLPVPAPPLDNSDTPDAEDETLRVLHVAGHAAIGDRNGTQIFAEALQLLGSKVHVTLVGQDGALPDPRLARHVTMERIPGGLPDRWDLYRRQHIIVLPRRYGGLCLPAIEACSRGVVPMMPDVPENSLWPHVGLKAREGRLQRVPFGMIPTWNVRPNDIAYRLDQLAKNRELLADLQERSLQWADDNAWAAWDYIYKEALA